jgi:hypothetical protein
MAKTSHDNTNEQGRLARSGEGLVRALCVLASFPFEAYQTLQDGRARTAIRTRGWAVLIGPLFSFMALLTCAPEILPRMPYMLLLPFVAFAIDQYITSESYAGHTTRALSLGRIALAIISVAMALVAGLLAEQTKLIKSTRDAETRAIESGSSSASSRFRQYERQASEVAAAIAANDARLLRERPAVVARRETPRQLWQKECYGSAGIDTQTGVQVIGGRCGRRAAGYKADAEAMERSLAELDQVRTDNERLNKELAEARRQQDAILERHLSSDHGLGVLLDAFMHHADWGTRIWILLRIFTIGLVELMAWWLSKGAAPANVLKALRDLEERDERRLELLNARGLLDLSRSLPTATFHIESGDPAPDGPETSIEPSSSKVIRLPIASEGGRA